ncbi:Endonuclease-reverse transcriptase [Popillia japonica]|uniref:Endonuclease-reverse transcriptase n=1 Tax=Popillia japonica TaxID=7064 RepID=A0AAW1LSN2_POPJA
METKKSHRGKFITEQYGDEEIVDENQEQMIHQNEQTEIWLYIKDIEKSLKTELGELKKQLTVHCNSENNKERELKNNDSLINKQNDLGKVEPEPSKYKRKNVRQVEPQKKLSPSVIKIYRPPAGDMDKFMMNISATLTVIAEKYQNNRIVLAGDFNIDLSGNSKEKAELINIGNMFALKHLIQVATRIGTTSTCIDNIFTDYDGNIMVNTVETHISDHLAQIARIKLLTSIRTMMAT